MNISYQRKIAHRPLKKEKNKKIQKISGNFYSFRVIYANCSYNSTDEGERFGAERKGKEGMGKKKRMGNMEAGKRMGGIRR